MPPVYRIAPELRVRELAPEQVLVAYRTVKVASPDDPELPLSFRSHYEEGLAPRLRQAQHTALHMAVSFWREEETSRLLAKRFPKHGGHVARVHLAFGHGIGYLAPEDEPDPQHLTIWAGKAILAEAVVAIVAVDP